ncbi:MAG: DUF7146 domain-containing protein [Propionivibrio sp.]
MHYGIAENFLRNKHGECPICGGKDRFRFDNKAGRGTFICNQCGAGDGFRLLEIFKGWTFKEAAYHVEQIVGTVSQTAIKEESDEAKKMASVKRVWNETEPVCKGDPVWLYLNRRVGIEIIPASIRFHPALAYVDNNSVEYHPALVAAVTDHSGVGIGVHRIYLTSSGEKAAVASGKKLLSGKPLPGASIKLGRAEGCIGISEGIETALAASRQFGITVWAAVSAGLMEQWLPPENITSVIICGDNDESFTGQASAYGLAKKLKARGVEAIVKIPELVGMDWADV